MTHAIRIVDELVSEWTKPPEILVIDDDQIFCLVFQRILEGTGCIISQAFTSDQASDLLAQRLRAGRKFDLIFLDLQLPSVNGAEVLRRVRQTMPPEVPVIIVTSSPESPLVIEALRHGYIGLMEKPVDFVELARVFARHKVHLQEKPPTPEPNPS